MLYHSPTHLTSGPSNWARSTLSGLLLVLLLTGCGSDSDNASSTGQTNPAPTGTAGAEEDVGERLFVETRFARAFKLFLDGGGKVNDPLPTGDPVMNETQTTGQPLPGPFAGMSMNCRACHLVDEQVGVAGGGMRTYADFARRSPVPQASDGHVTSPRHAPPLVGASVDRPVGTLFHLDGEFATMEDLVAGTFTDRNFGWMPGQKAEAIQQLARVIREDDGKGNLAQEFDGQSYRMLLAGTDPAIPEDFRLPSDFRINVDSSTDEEVFNAVVRLVSAYVTGLEFSQEDEDGVPIRSPFDIFLEVNNLPPQPDQNELPLDYSRRLRGLVAGLQNPIFVQANPNRSDGKFQFHDQPFQFGAKELEGLKIFLSEPQTATASPEELAQGKIGNCVRCHAAPHFTDFKLHNTGVNQKEYDDLHGAGQFAQLAIPSLSARKAAPQQYLPATHEHPTYQGPFRSPPSASNPALTDLGLWNIFANPDMPNPQATIRAILCEDQPSPCPSDDVLLPLTIARFKTLSLRDLGHSAPYMHNGQLDTLDDIVTAYRNSSNAARGGTLRNHDPLLLGIALTASDVSPLVAFLHSLNEDYQ
ncbi:MAG: hypothetical protein AB7G48_06985 [Nitrospiraceae bacterium]